jgi:hypothetical protein
MTIKNAKAVNPIIAISTKKRAILPKSFLSFQIPQRIRFLPDQKNTFDS